MKTLSLATILQLREEYSKIKTVSVVETRESVNRSVFNSSDLKTLFECPVCYDYITPPIYQCLRGHPVCSSCLSKLHRCPTCRESLSPRARNLIMEKICALLKFPCKYSQYGCKKNLSSDCKNEHEIQCHHRQYECPCPGITCSWLGSINEVRVGTNIIRWYST
ncbi:hypothetical protein HZS_6827 [Henneguya salminicola]|nr:hypothetical protein HZS_6827 [Henneguya salminicola]